MTQDRVLGRVVKRVLHVGLLNADGTNGEALKLTTRELLDLTIHDVVQLCP